MRNLLAKLFKRTPKNELPLPPMSNKPLMITPFDGGVVINGLNDEDSITVGMTDAPDPAADGEFTTHNCIVSYYEGSIDADEPNAVALLHSLAEMLGYEVKRRKSQPPLA